MPATCKICVHDQREAIDRAILAGTSLRTIAGSFAVGRTAVQRHGANHVHAADVRAEVAKSRKKILADVAAAAPAEPVRLNTPADVLDELRWAYGETKALYERAKAGHDTRLMDKAIGQGAALLDRFAKSFGMFADGATTVNIDNRSVKAAAFYDALPTDVLRKLKAGEIELEAVMEALPS